MIARAGLVAIAALGPGCLIKPDRVALDGDGGVDAPGDSGPPSMVPRHIANAYYSDGNAATTGMSHTGFSIKTDGIVSGDLVLFIANVDNGSSTLWPNPIADGFHQVAQEFFGNDGQTYVVAWKIAGASEPATYSNTYGPGIGSSAAAITLIAIAGANPADPIPVFSSAFTTTDSDPVPAPSAGLATTAANTTLIYAAGADWRGEAGTNTFDIPSGFTKLTAFGDKGDTTFDWTSQMVAYAVQPQIGDTGAIKGQLHGLIGATPVVGTGWAVVLAVPPAP